MIGFWELVGGLLLTRAAIDLWDCFGFGCDDMCEWLGKMAEKCKEKQEKKHAVGEQSTHRGAL